LRTVIVLALAAFLAACDGVVPDSDLMPHPIFHPSEVGG
jgi:hypothetical protein